MRCSGVSLYVVRYAGVLVNKCKFFKSVHTNVSVIKNVYQSLKTFISQHASASDGPRRLFVSQYAVDAFQKKLSV